MPEKQEEAMTADDPRLAAIRERRHLRLDYLPTASITHMHDPTVEDDLGYLLSALARLQAERDEQREQIRLLCLHCEEEAAEYREEIAAAEASRDAAQQSTAALRAAAEVALYEMCRTVAPRDSFTDAVDALDAALADGTETP